MASKSTPKGVPGLIIALLLFGIYFLFTQMGKEQEKPPETNFPGQVDLPELTDQIRIGTFNIQVFGQSKLEDEKSAAILARIVRQFDVLAVQELRSKEQDVVPRFLELVNADGAQFDAVVGPRQGASVSQEQYVYFYNRKTIELMGDPDPFVVPPPLGAKLHRSPYVARFRTRGVPANEAFTFILLNIHTDPDLVPQELSALAEIFPSIQKQFPSEDDVILLGDLNANNKKFTPFTNLPNRKMMWILTDPEQPTNTAKTEQYDNLLLDQGRTEEYNFNYGVYDFPTRFELDEETAKKVSDHLPVWGEFNIREQR